MSSKPGCDSAQQGQDRGVYTLANDAVIEWFEAFIRSFRRWNPELPLTVIPYNTSTIRLERLAQQYGFNIMKNSECSHFDDIGSMVKCPKRSVGMFRKWACFFGQYDEFIFLDADIVVLSQLERILSAFSSASYDLVYFDTSIEVVYKQEAISEMQTEYGSVGFIAGAFVSRKTAITYELLEEISQRAAGESSKFFTTFDVGDQPFMNYVFDVSRRRLVRIDSIIPVYAKSTWVRQSVIYDWRTDEVFDHAGKIMPFIHWAGCAFPTMVKPGEFLRYRTQGYALLEKIRYAAFFYFQRHAIGTLKKMRHAQLVLIKFSTSKVWRKYYFCKLMGIKVDFPA